MSNEAIQGAAPAAPGLSPAEAGSTIMTAPEVEALEIAAREAVQQVTDPDEAEALLDRITDIAGAVALAKLGAEYEVRWKRVRLKAERRYGELLPPRQTKAEAGRVGGKQQQAVTSSSKADGVAQRRARKVAAVPQAEFDDYVDNSSKPTREGLLRAARSKPSARSRPRRTPMSDPPPHPTKAVPPPPYRREPFTAPSVCDNPAVIKWVYDREREGWDRRRMIEASRDNKDGWPVPDDELSNGTHSTAIQVIKWMLKEGYEPGADNSPPVRQRRASRRLREYRARQKAGDSSYLTDVLYRMAQVTDMLESVDITAYAFETEVVQDQMRDLADELSELLTWCEGTLDAIKVHLDDQHLLGLIERLRTMHAGMGEHERAGHLAAAERLERRLERKRLARANGNDDAA